MAQSSTAQLFGLGRNDPLFARVRIEAEEAARRDPALASFLMTAILNHDTLEHAVVHRVAERLDHRDAPGAMIRQAYEDAIARDSSIGAAFRADIVAVVDRDPACLRMMEPLLYFKGFHALQTHRLAHALLKSGRRDFALYLQSRASSVFGVDINPAARIGKGIFLDHATGLVVGETTVIDDDVSRRKIALSATRTSCSFLTTLLTRSSFVMTSTASKGIATRPPRIPSRIPLRTFDFSFMTDLPSCKAPCVCPPI